MLRCECRARLGRGWNFCEACGRPVPEDSGVLAPAPEVATASEGTAPMVESVQPVLAAMTQMAQGMESVTPVPPKVPALLLSRLDWRFAVLPLLLGWVLEKSALSTAFFSRFLCMFQIQFLPKSLKHTLSLF